MFFDDRGAENLVAGIVEAAVVAEEASDVGRKFLAFLGWRDFGGADIYTRNCLVVFEFLEFDTASN